QARLASVRAEPGRGNAPCWPPAPRYRGPTFTNGNSAMELWQSDTEALPLTWDLVDPFPTVYELGDGEHRYASLRRPPREGWLWNWEWIAETATSRWAIRSGGLAFVRARDRIIDMATDSPVGVFRSWFTSSGVLELTDGERYKWKAPWTGHHCFTGVDGNGQV